MRKLKHSLLTALLLLSTGFVFSQPIKFKKKLDAKQNGIPFIFSIVQDQKGFIWFTSPTKGLQRYDGKKIITYSHNNDNTNSLANNLAFAAAVDSAGHIWVGTLGSFGHAVLGVEGGVDFGDFPGAKFRASGQLDIQRLASSTVNPFGTGVPVPIEMRLSMLSTSKET